MELRVTNVHIRTDISMSYYKCFKCGKKYNSPQERSLCAECRESKDVPLAILSWSLDVECPKCRADIDLTDIDDEGYVSMAIFNNKWDDLEGLEVECPECEHEFMISGVEY